MTWCSGLAHVIEIHFREIKHAKSSSLILCLPMFSGPVLGVLLWVSLDFVQPITGQVTEVTCRVIGRSQPELTPSKRQKTHPLDRKSHGISVYGIMGTGLDC